MLAYFTAWIMRPHLKEAIEPKQILAPLREEEMKQDRKADREYMMKEFRLGGIKNEHDK